MWVAKDWMTISILWKIYGNGGEYDYTKGLYNYNTSTMRVPGKVGRFSVLGSLLGRALLGMACCRLALMR